MGSKVARRPFRTRAGRTAVAVRGMRRVPFAFAPSSPREFDPHIHKVGGPINPYSRKVENGLYHSRSVHVQVENLGLIHATINA